MLHHQSRQDLGRAGKRGILEGLAKEAVWEELGNKKDDHFES